MSFFSHQKTMFRLQPDSLMPQPGDFYERFFNVVTATAMALLFAEDEVTLRRTSRLTDIFGASGYMRGGLLSIPQCIDDRLTNDGKAVSPTHMPRFTPPKHIFLNVSGTHFC
jgi:hypothetical protein